MDPDPARVRFLGFAESSLQLEIFSYIQTEDFDDFLEVQEDLNLRIMQVVADSGSSFALGSQTLYLAEDSGLSIEKRATAEAQVQKWRATGELDIPKFDPQRIADLRHRITYPPEGSSAARQR